MATVWLARDLRHDRPVALKVMRPELAASLGSARFLREVRLCARLQHPHILAVLDSGAVGQEGAGAELLWFTMPFVEGESLRGRIARDGQLPLADALRIAREVADGLHYAHQHGVIHRDIKPENILLSGSHALIADFGIARALAADDERDDRLTETGITLGTPQYMSPEQAAGDRGRGCAQRHLLAGLRPVRDAGGRAAVHRTEPAGHPRQAAHRAGAPPRRGSGAAARGGSRGRAGAGPDAQ